MPLPLIIPVALAVLGAWGVGKGASAYADSQREEAATLKNKLALDIEKHDASLSEAVNAYRSAASEYILAAQRILLNNGLEHSDFSKLDVDRCLKDAELPEEIKRAVQSLKTIAARQIDLQLLAVDGESKTLNSVGKLAPYINNIGRTVPAQMIPSGLGPIAGLALAGVVVWEAGTKLASVVGNAQSLSDMKAAGEELSKAYTTRINSVTGDKSTIQSSGPVLVNFMSRVDGRNASNHKMLLALFATLWQSANGPGYLKG